MDKVFIPVQEKIRDFDDRVDIMLTQYGGLFGEMLARSDGDWDGVVEILQAGMDRKRRVLEMVVASRAQANAAGHFLEHEIPY